MRIIIFLCLIVGAQPLVAKANRITEDSFLVLSDIHLDLDSTHRMEISPPLQNAANDLDAATFEQLMAELKITIEEARIIPPKFILILGDIAGHKRLSSNSAIENEAYVFRQLKNSFPSKPILYVFGNNDSVQKNYGPFSDNDRDVSHRSPYEIARHEGGWENGFLSTGVHCGASVNFPCLHHQEPIQGYYSAYLEHKLRLIALNTVLFSSLRPENLAKEAENELEWLERELDEAQVNQEQVLLAMHIPPGNNVSNHQVFWLEKEQAYFLRLIKKHQSNLIALLAAHTHADEIKIIQGDEQEVISGVYLAPGLSTSHGNEPAVKSFSMQYQDQHWQMSNYESFHFSEDNGVMLFDKLYDFVHYYCDDKDAPMYTCLSQVTASKMDKYFAAGNRYYNGGRMQSPEDLILLMLKQPIAFN